MMLKTEAMQTCLHQLRSEFPVGSVDSEQAASHDTLGSTAFIHVHVGCLSADHSLMRAHHSVDGHGVGAGAVEYKRHDSLFAEMFLEQLLHAGAIFIVAVSQRVVDVGIGYSLQNLGTDARMVVASESSSHFILFLT